MVTNKLHCIKVANNGKSPLAKLPFLATFVSKSRQKWQLLKTPKLPKMASEHSSAMWLVAMWLHGSKLFLRDSWLRNCEGQDRVWRLSWDLLISCHVTCDLLTVISWSCTRGHVNLYTLSLSHASKSRIITNYLFIFLFLLGFFSFLAQEPRNQLPFNLKEWRLMPNCMLQSRQWRACNSHDKWSRSPPSVLAYCKW